MTEWRVKSAMVNRKILSSTHTSRTNRGSTWFEMEKLAVKKAKQG